MFPIHVVGTTKSISSLAKLINHGECIWASGDLIMDSNADFLNLGIRNSFIREYSRIIKKYCV